MKKLLIFLSLNLLIGNVVAWFMGAAPIEFKPVPYSQQEQALISELKAELAENADDPALQTQLGSLYSLHNQLDDAGQLLTAASASGDDATALAWLSGTRAKQAGAMFDPLMGLRKLYLLRSACSDMDRAVAMDPENFEVRMVRLATYAPTAVMNCSLETAFTDEAWFKQYFAAQGALAPLELKLQFNLTMSIAYAKAGGSDNQQTANNYMAEYQKLSRETEQPPLVLEQLAAANKLLTEGS
ncbi:hypothetical protein SG34_030490 [Thalassomonas viridans]|uniref:Uncharacterized protein n=1 Tax=Thalassomonas viridans TaxID=137584 RepID=A0AAE9Z987_9GAMM|nr:hypothetical protein [Thalassomonas viridans]WDE09100.1 hypothetical protein SG34_030490 [Thalassomonas viridans]